MDFDDNFEGGISMSIMGWDLGSIMGMEFGVHHGDGIWVRHGDGIWIRHGDGILSIMGTFVTKGCPPLGFCRAQRRPERPTCSQPRATPWVFICGLINRPERA